MNTELINIDWSGRQVQIEYQWLTSEPRSEPSSEPSSESSGEQSALPLMVFLHEGLGSLAMWKDFPQRLCNALGWRGLVYSRPGYGQSTARDADEHWAADFMHRQAHQVLPALLRALHVDTQEHPPWLLGHSDGGSIALLYAARYPQALAGAIVLAPHIMVEDVSLRSIEKTRQAYEQGNLRASLARYHHNPDSAFWGWNDIWLHPSFKTWSIEAELACITCPLLAVQGLDDEYGTLAQIHGIAQQVPQTQLLELANCGHSPQRDQTTKLLAALGSFVGLHHHTAMKLECSGARGAAPHPET